MSLSNPIYLASHGDARELEHSVKLCLMWQPLMSCVSFPMAGSWDSMCKGSELEIISDHVVMIHELAGRRAVKEVKEADANLSAGLEMKLRAGDWLKSVADSIQKNFLRSMEQGGTSARAATLIGIWSAVFHVPLLTAVQSALFLEWRSREERQSLASLTRFFQTCADPPLQSILHRHLSRHESAAKPRFAALR